MYPMKLEHTTVMLETELKREAETQAAKEGVKPADVIRRWMRLGRDTEVKGRGK